MISVAIAAFLLGPEKPETPAAVLVPVVVEGTEEQVEKKQMVDRAIRAYGIDRELAVTVYEVALREKIPPNIAYGLVRVESQFNPRARSPVGARGLTQLMPGTARLLKRGVTLEELYRPEVNLSLGFRHLHYLLRYYDGDLRLALTAYNRGHGTVDRLLREGEDPFNGYAREVLRRSLRAG